MPGPTDNFEKVLEFLQAAIAAGSYDPVTHVFTPGGGSFPTFTGTGSPEGVQTATAIGQTYQDSATGALYFYYGTPPSNTGWILTIGLVVSSSDKFPSLLPELTGTFLCTQDGFTQFGPQKGNTVGHDSYEFYFNNTYYWELHAGSGSPQGVYALGGVGNWYYDATNFDLYIAKAAGDSHWTKIVATGVDGTTTLPGSIATPVVTESAPYSMVGNEAVILTNSSVTLPPPSAYQNFQYTVKDNGAGTASVLHNAAETIDGVASKSLIAYESVTVVSDGTNWFII